MSDVRASLANRFLSKYIGVDVDNDKIEKTGWTPAGRVCELFFTDCDISVNISFVNGKIDIAKGDAKAVGRLSTTLDTLEYLRMGKERILKGGVIEWRPYSAIDAYRYGDIKIEGDVPTGIIMLVSRALDAVIRPALDEKGIV